MATGPTQYQKLSLQVTADLKDLKRKMGDMRREVRGFNKGAQDFRRSLINIGGALGVAFGVREIARFGLEAVKLAGQMEGVEAAFKRIGGEAIFEDLRKATKGTVTDLELMKRAVQASNFDIPLENLASLFQFASKRAQETGESVDYLVNSIVLGIGRKSPLILDNLGISAVRLRKELKGTGVEMTTVADIAAAVGKIASTEMAEAGDIIETTAIKTQQLTTEMQNLKVELGQGLVPAFNKLLAGANAVLTVFKDIVETAKEFPALLRFVFGGERDPEIAKKIRKERGYVAPPLSEFIGGFNPRDLLKSFGPEDLLLQIFDEEKNPIRQINKLVKRGWEGVHEVDQMAKELSEGMFNINDILNRPAPEAPGGPGRKDNSLFELIDGMIFKLRELNQEASVIQQQIGGAITGMFEQFAVAFTSGQNVLQQMLDYFKKWVAQMIAQIAAIAAASLLLSFIPGLGGFGGIFSNLFGGSGIGQMIGNIGQLKSIGQQSIKVTGNLSSVVKGGDLHFLLDEFGRKRDNTL